MLSHRPLSIVQDLSETLQYFVTYVQTHLTGDEQGKSAEEAAGEKITPACLPLPVEEHGEFLTENCI